MKKGFTLIELLAVIVVLAILALVVTPIVLNIVENAQTGSDERSLEQYAKVMQTAFYEEKMSKPELTLASFLQNVDDVSGISLTYNGSKVVCREKIASETASGTIKIELRYCTIDGRGLYNFIDGKAVKDEDSDVPDRKSFAEDSWQTIVGNVKKGNISKYKVGDTKEINLGTLGKHTVRIANTSTPAECKTSGFSQTACGFVIEFKDVVSRYVMNEAITNVGSWPASNVRAYINKDIYNALPEELRVRVIDTYVVSGHGSNDSSNFISTDKLYLLSATEIWNQTDYDTAKYVTRQLDYYKGVTTNNYSKVIKKYNGSNYWWWLRSAYSSYNHRFYLVNDSGSVGVTNSDFTYGISPAFRIG